MQLASSQTYNANGQKKTHEPTRYNLNDTMPVGGLGTGTLSQNMLRQGSAENGIKNGVSGPG